MDSQRHAFDIPDDVSYLNCAYMGPLSRTVVDAGRAGLERKMRPWTVSASDFFDPVDRVRELFAQVVNADADGVAILPAVSYGCAIAAANIPFTKGQKILLLDEQFPSNVYIWRELAEREGGEIVTVPRPSDHDWTSVVLERLIDGVAIAALEICHWTDGGKLDIVAVSERCREIGCALVIDGTQSIGALPFDITAVQPDFLITAVYKWLLAPYGAAMMWVGPQYREGRPLELSWITRRGSADFAGLVDYESRLREGAKRYDVGQTSNFVMIPSLEAAFTQTLEWGVDNICVFAGGLSERVAAGAAELGLSVAPAEHRAPHLVGVHLGGSDPEAVAKSMAASNVFVSVRGESMRVSSHVFNDESDVERLFLALRDAL